jgi:hypothetical protein
VVRCSLPNRRSPADTPRIADAMHRLAVQSVADRPGSRVPRYRKHSEGAYSQMPDSGSRRETRRPPLSLWVTCSGLPAHRNDASRLSPNPTEPWTRAKPQRVAAAGPGRSPRCPATPCFPVRRLTDY